MRMTVILIVIGVLRTVLKDLELGLEELEIGERIETIETTASLRTARILRKVLEISRDSNGRLLTYAGVKNSPGAY